jgi:hypothetical protein
MTTRAVVTKEFPGVPDGKVYPKTFKVGDPVEGSLADAAIAEKWARKLKNGEDASEADKPPAPKGTEGGAEQKEPATGTEQVEIPADWQTMKWPALKKLVQDLTGTVPTEAKEVPPIIEAELKRRAEAAAAQTK